MLSKCVFYYAGCRPVRISPLDGLQNRMQFHHPLQMTHLRYIGSPTTPLALHATAPVASPWYCATSSTALLSSAAAVMHKTVVINVVGLSADLVGVHTPRLSAWIAGRSAAPSPETTTPPHLAPVGPARRAFIRPVLPAVTCSVQSTYLTGKHPTDHGIVGNGWYFRDDAEVRFWRQSNALVQAPKVWDAARAADPTFTVANLFWWYAMYSTADISVTPRPCYPADGRKLPDIHTKPAQLRDDLQGALGQFPLFSFWGPATNISASRWIADAALAVDAKSNPTLTLVYLPHLDYVLQREGPGAQAVARDLNEVDAVVGDLITHYEAVGSRVIVLSEYGITAVDTPVHINRALRAAGLLAVRIEDGRELLDAGASSAFAVVDHQVAHVYLNDSDPALATRVRELVTNLPGVARVLESTGKAAEHIDHHRAGNLVAVATTSSWFTYYYWPEGADDVAPDFARTVDIHRKPGYDPVELFLDPELTFAKGRVAWRLAQKIVGMRYLMDVIPLNAKLVKGSHGTTDVDPASGAVLYTKADGVLDGKLDLNGCVDATAVYDIILETLRTS